jgi:hypothetical protein
MSLSGAPHAVDPKKHNVPTVETITTIPSGEFFMLFTPYAEKT